MERKINSGMIRSTVLVVDDDPAILILIQTVLSSAGYRVLVARTGEDAIRLVDQKHLHIDLALLDIRLPHMTGTQLARQITSVRPALRVLLMSGFVDEEIIRIKLVKKTFLSKPFGNDGLLSAVAQALEEEPSSEEHSPKVLYAGSAPALD